MHKHITGVEPIRTLSRQGTTIVDHIVNNVRDRIEQSFTNYGELGLDVKKGEDPYPIIKTLDQLAIAIDEALARWSNTSFYKDIVQVIGEERLKYICLERLKVEIELFQGAELTDFGT